MTEDDTPPEEEPTTDQTEAEGSPEVAEDDATTEPDHGDATEGAAPDVDEEDDGVAGSGATDGSAGTLEEAADRHGTSDDHDGSIDADSKRRQLDRVREQPAGHDLTTDQGVGVPDTDNSLTAGERGPTLMEDFQFRETMTHFDHERIPERVVHARGTGVHGYFEPYDDYSHLTKASFLQDPEQKTPVFVRFSTVVGSRGSADTVRDVRGFATKFYTEDGVYDLVANNMPVFFIQDAMKFPDLVHSIKPEPDTQVPQASAAHDTFWDFASLTPEITHMLMWVLSDRALPRYYRTMEGFGVHTFRLIDEDGQSRFAKFHWRPAHGTHQLVWDETQTLAGKDPDFNRKSLYEAIENGTYPEFELGLQVVEEDEADRFDFDLLDPTKIIPEEEVPLEMVGRMVLNETPDNFFAETEQVAFHPGNVVPGIDFTNDPLLQGRLFSYQDTQLNRFNGANWDEVPINRPLAEVHNNQRDGFMRQTINEGTASYSPNSLEDDYPRETGPRDAEEGQAGPDRESEGFVHHDEAVGGRKLRVRPESFRDHFTQAKLFWNSMTEPERDHIVSAAHFELGKVDSDEVQRRVVYELFNNVDHEFARRVAEGIGVDPPEDPGEHHADHDRSSPAVSMERDEPSTVASRKVAVLLEAGFDDDHVESVRSALEERDGTVSVVSEDLGEKSGEDGGSVETDVNHVTTASVAFDAVFVPGGSESVESMTDLGDAKYFVAEAFKHKKPIAAVGAGVELLETAGLTDVELADGQDEGLVVDQGVVTAGEFDDPDAFVDAFVEAIEAHRHWERSPKELQA